MEGWGKGWGVARKLRVQYSGAIYHLINRGDQREPIFKDDADRARFLKTLGQCCTKTEWQVHAWCLMNNHLRRRRKGDPKKVRIARRLREKTTRTLKWIAGELYMGAWTHVSNLLSQARRGKKQRRDDPEQKRICSCVKSLDRPLRLLDPFLKTCQGLLAEFSALV